MKPNRWSSRLGSAWHWAWVWLVAAALQGAEPGAGAPLRVMSFNIRYGTANDGTNSWAARRELVVKVIRDFDPDLLGLQEVLESQALFLRAELPAWGFQGVGRDDGRAGGEFSPVFYRTNRFELVDWGCLWLSATPEVAGSRGWDAALPRVATWVRLRDRQNGGQPLLYANTHFDHRGAQARLESARLLRVRLGELAQGALILTGDFNATEDDPPYAALTAKADPPGAAWTDAYRAVHPVRAPDEASFHAWQGTRAGSRIDWILFSGAFGAASATIDRTAADGRLPSDHYPVTAVLDWRTAP